MPTVRQQSWKIYHDRGQFTKVIVNPQRSRALMSLLITIMVDFTTTVVRLFKLISLGRYIYRSLDFVKIIFYSLLSFYEFKRTLRAFKSYEAWITRWGWVVIIVPIWLTCLCLFCIGLLDLFWSWAASPSSVRLMM